MITKLEPAKYVWSSWLQYSYLFADGYNRTARLREVWIENGPYKAFIFSGNDADQAHDLLLRYSEDFVQINHPDEDDDIKWVRCFMSSDDVIR